VTGSVFPDIPRETLEDATGRPLLAYVRSTRDGSPAADLVEVVAGVSDQDAAAAALSAFPGWAFSGSVALGGLLSAAGATTIRHAHVMTRDLTDGGVDPGWVRAEPARPELSVAAPPSDARAYLDLLEVAYPAGHPDHVPRSEEDRLAHDIVPLLDGTLGPLLEGSGVVLERRRGAAPSMVAVCLVTDMEHSGPWVVDVARRPGGEYAGLGGLLLRRALAVLAATGLPSLGLAVSDGNPARSTYERLGFVEVLESLTVKLPGG
jgi:hypothetical protein